MRASELRFIGEIEQLDGNTWSSYATAFFAAEVTSESEGIKQYALKTRKTQALTYITGLRELNAGFRILLNLDGEQHIMEIDSAMLSGPRRDELHFLCHEIES